MPAVDAFNGGTTVVAGNSGSQANGLQNFWDAFTHPISMLTGAIKANNAGIPDEYDTMSWSSQDWINYARNGTLPNGATVGSNVVPNNSNSPDATTDVTGYDQALWDLDKTKELLAEQRAYNSAEAEKNRQWQERMSNSAYQRAVEDLKAAGLNKWLAVTGGNGASASTPSGSSASSQAGDASTPNPQLAKAMLQFGQSIIGSILKLVK